MTEVVIGGTKAGPDGPVQTEPQTNFRDHASSESVPNGADSNTVDLGSMRTQMGERVSQYDWKGREHDTLVNTPFGQYTLADLIRDGDVVVDQGGHVQLPSSSLSGAREATGEDEQGAHTSGNHSGPRTALRGR